MNFEKYIGKKVRIETNILNDYGQYKIIEGIYEGHDSIGQSNYFIISGESYPEMCINKFGLVPEVKEDVKTKEVVEEEFISAYTLQVDPMLMINKSIDEIELVEEEEKFHWKNLLTKDYWTSGETIAKGISVLVLIVCIIVGTALQPHTDYRDTTTQIPSYAMTTFNPISEYPKACTMTNDTLSCNDTILYKHI